MKSRLHTATTLLMIGLAVLVVATPAKAQEPPATPVGLSLYDVGEMIKGDETQKLVALAYTLGIANATSNWPPHKGCTLNAWELLQAIREAGEDMTEQRRREVSAAGYVRGIAEMYCELAAGELLP